MKLILLLIGHFLGDFVFQTNTIATKKRKFVPYFVLHCSIYFICILLTSVLYGNVFSIVAISLAISFVHCIIDGIKISIGHEKSFLLYIVDQILHLLTIVFASFFVQEPNMLWVLTANWFQHLFTQIQLEKASFVLLCYIICANPAGISISLALSKIHAVAHKGVTDNYVIIEKTKSIGQTENGFIIGILERFCILTLTILSQYTAISFVIAAKSLARLKKLEDDDFAEKYLVGTFMSFLIAILLGCLIGLKS